MKEKPKHFPRGFHSWIETHFDIVYSITLILNNEDVDEDSILYKRYEDQGQGGLYELAQEITDEFELEYQDAEWSADFDYYETLENFLNTRL